MPITSEEIRRIGTGDRVRFTAKFVNEFCKPRPVKTRKYYTVKKRTPCEHLCITGHSGGCPGEFAVLDDERGEDVSYCLYHGRVAAVKWFDSKPKELNVREVI